MTTHVPPGASASHACGLDPQLRFVASRAAHCGEAAKQGGMPCLTSPALGSHATRCAIARETPCTYAFVTGTAPQHDTRNDADSCRFWRYWPEA